ncbi:Gfo/Idh/MocA family oxidoreductase [Halalkalibacter alkaliphilus]|uniref:Gfo/Idh/MocA family protein n=1 Tax=Halalkalibacter alkaliphilus TaxID=2917993 RepID=UPI0030846806
MKVGIIGCGTISNVYMDNLTQRYKLIEVIACADMFVDKAKELASKYSVPKACSVEELLEDPDVEIVLNLTIPAAHFEINMAALEVGKHVYCEKPLALNLEEAEKSIEFARSKGLMLGCSPDSFLGAGIQTSKKVLDDGWIGSPVAVTANFMCHGHELWHPAPDFYYKEGGGPMLDMGPYYITAMVALLGPIKKITCLAKKTHEERTVLNSNIRSKKSIDVDVLTHYSGLMEFENGVIATVNMSFDVWFSNLPKLEIYGTEGTLMVPDPNMFGGPVKLIRGDNMVDSIEGYDWIEAVKTVNNPSLMGEFVTEFPLAYHNVGYNSRGLGVLDMANALLQGRPHRTNGDLTYHVMEALLAFEKTAEDGTTYIMESTCEKPTQVPTGLRFGELD